MLLVLECAGGQTAATRIPQRLHTSLTHFNGDHNHMTLVYNYVNCISNSQLIHKILSDIPCLMLIAKLGQKILLTFFLKQLLLVREQKGI